MARLVGGIDSALNDLMSRHGPKLFNYLLRCLQNEEDAADLAQETFVRVFQHRQKFDRRQKFSTWLYTIATNLVRTRYRFRTRHPESSLETLTDSGVINLADRASEQSDNPSESLQAAERQQTVRRAVAQLPEELRTALILSEYEELSHAEIGTVLHCSAKAVELRLYRARQQLRVKLAGLLSK